MVGIIRALVLAVTLSNFICDVRCLTKPHVAVVGAGFGGWGAVKALCENGCRVTLLDVLPDPTGATPYVTPTGKPDSEIRTSARLMKFHLPKCYTTSFCIQ
jgi:NAD(P)-binding Rossmann-like domain